VREICLDTETTGFYPKNGDRIVEIGCVELTKHGISENFFHQIINPERTIPDEVIKVHGITNEKVQGKPTFLQVADKFLEFVKGARLIIHNAPFDVAFIDEELKRIGKGTLKSYGCEIYDSLELAKQKYPGQHNSLDKLCDRLEMPISHMSRDDGHGAYIDAKLLAQVYLKLREFQNDFGLDAMAGGKDQLHFSGDVSKLKVIHADEEELTAHEKYLDGMEKKMKRPCNYREAPEAFEALRQEERQSLAAGRKKIEDIIASLK